MDWRSGGTRYPQDPGDALALMADGLIGLSTSMRTRGRQVYASQPGWSGGIRQLLAGQLRSVRLLHFTAALLAGLTLNCQISLRDI